MIVDNYKRKKSVTAIADGALTLKRPATLYIDEDEVYISGDVAFGTSTNNPNTWADPAGVYSINSDDEIVASNASNTCHIEEAGLLTIGKKYKMIVDVKSYTSGTLKAYAGGNDTAFNVSGPGRYSLTVTMSPTNNKVGILGSSLTATISSVSYYEVIDHSYKLKAVSDNMPNSAISVDGEMTDLLTSDQHTALGDTFNTPNDAITFYGSSGTNMIGTDKFTAAGVTYTINGSFISGKGKMENTAASAGYVYMPFASVKNSKYILSVDVVWGDSSNVDICLSSNILWNADAENLNNNGGPSSGDSHRTYTTPEFVASGSTSYILIRNTSSVDEAFSYTDNIRVYGIYGLDSYISPQYRQGLVSDIWDKDTGRLKTVAADGDKVEVQLQGEITTSAQGNDSETIEDVITKISTNGYVTGVTLSEDNIPNSFGVVTASTSGTNEVPIILWQGVDMPRLFPHSSSVRANVKCGEAITKYRPVSLYLDSNGDVNCIHDDLPNEASADDRDYVSLSPGKWGIAEETGATGDVIPVTVAGKTYINTSTTALEGQIIRRIQQNGTLSQYAVPNDNYIPNALGTILDTGRTGSTGDVPISLFTGVPTGQVTDFKNVVKITAKALANVSQYCPVSIYLDKYGDYMCEPDVIPNNQTDDANAIWIDKRKWGIAQATVGENEMVEVVVQGRTYVKNTHDDASQGSFVRQILKTGQVKGLTATIHALSTLGRIEVAADDADNLPGVIVIY